MEKLYYILNKSNDLPPLMMRLLMAFCFIKAGITKIENIEGIINFFAQADIILPSVMVHIVIFMEIVGGILLFLGYFTRTTAFALAMVMVVALRSVHFGNGFSVENNGVEIPLYYLVFLLSLVIYGAGNVSLDYLITGRKSI
jgi:putative oxidoreductase